MRVVGLGCGERGVPAFGTSLEHVLARPFGAMDKNDWVFVGVRLLGMFLLAEGLVTLPLIIAAGPRAGAAEAQLIMGPLLHIAVGVVLAVGTARICRWLGGHGPGR